ncbi:MAG: D-alanyl-D-alanine carboxypeptidase/D-alanyl-D-alanine-endopeptidase [Muribaculaceae bacterium]
MKRNIIFVFAIAFWGILFCDAINLDRDIRKFTSNPLLSHASVGVSVMDIESGEIVGDVNGNISQIPASTMKTVTSATALSVLGEGYEFHTRVFIDGSVGRNGTLKGNVRIVGGGDPTLGSKWIKAKPSFIALCINALKERGIKKIKGDIIIDNSIFALPSRSPLWMLEDIAWDYGAGAFGLNYADNTFDVVLDVSAGDSATVVHTSPLISDVTIDNKLAIKDNAKGYDLTVGDHRNIISIVGDVSRKAELMTITCANPFPELSLRDSLIISLEKAKIKISRKHLKVEKESDLLLDYKSPKLEQILHSLLERSDNMFTECVLRAMALNAGQVATASNGIDIVKEYWGKRGLDTNALFMKDGSGLARNNKVSSQFLVKMLAVMMRDNGVGVSFNTLFPVAGKESTVGSLLSNTDYAGSFAVKSGSMSEVQCFAGYYPADNPKYSVAILVNNYHCTRAELIKNIEKLLINIFSSIKK